MLTASPDGPPTSAREGGAWRPPPPFSGTFSPLRFLALCSSPLMGALGVPNPCRPLAYASGACTSELPVNGMASRATPARGEIIMHAKRDRGQ